MEQKPHLNQGFEMNKFRVPLIITAASLIILLFSGMTHAFHEGGEEFCLGCHNMHSPQANQDPSMDENAGHEPVELTLKGSDPSSTCLSCHAQGGAAHKVLSNDGSVFTPGGDFYWLRKTFSWTRGSLHFQSKADHHGHNIVAIDYGMYSDGRFNHAPGGSYPSAALGCTSCHDPHAITAADAGNMGVISGSSSYSQATFEGTTAGNFRLLGGAGYTSSQLASSAPFRNGAPIAAASPFNWTETDANHTAYGSGMSEWCANCHPSFLNSSSRRSGGEHPSGNDAKLDRDIADTYNRYVKTGDLGGSQASAYLLWYPSRLAPPISYS
jgi:hypothetical protein